MPWLPNLVVADHLDAATAIKEMHADLGVAVSVVSVSEPRIAGVVVRLVVDGHLGRHRVTVRVRTRVTVHESVCAHACEIEHSVGIHPEGPQFDPDLRVWSIKVRPAPDTPVACRSERFNYVPRILTGAETSTHGFVV